MEDQIKKYRDVHPGRVIEREYIKRNISQRELAAEIGEHYQTLNAVINGRRKLTLELARKLDLAFRFEPGTLYVLQAYYEAEKYRLKRVDELPKVAPNIRKVVFWDVDFDKINWLRYKKFALDRVFERGSAEEKKEILRFYDMDHYDYVVDYDRLPRCWRKHIINPDNSNHTGVQFASDLHLEFHPNSEFLANNPIVPVADILVLAGDIGHIGHGSYSTHPFWDWASANFKEVLVVPGNHEFYGGHDLKNISDGLEVNIRKNVKWYYNSVVWIGDIEFILTPLWSNIFPVAEQSVCRQLPDFKYIGFNGQRLTIPQYRQLHADCVKFLNTALSQQKNGRRIVATHHVPSFRCVPEEFKNSMLNSAFYSDLDAGIEKSDIDYWIYGHSHRNVGEIKIGNTILVSNQLGYVQLNEHNSFISSRQIL